MTQLRIPRRWKFLTLAFVLLALPVGSSYYKYYYTANYDYLIEAECDASIEKCFSRDCTDPDQCPPNGLSSYKQFYVKAYDFHKCSDNSCKKECNSSIIECIPILCGDSTEDVCSEQAK